MFKAVFILLAMRYCAGSDSIYERIKACRYDSDCIENAYCKEQSYCQCKDSYIIFLNSNNTFSCLEQALRIDDLCEQDIQCTKPFGNHAICSANKAGIKTCKCIDGAHFKEGRCYETAYIGQKCLVSNNCYLRSGIPAYCEKSICTCGQRYHPNQEGTDCIKSAFMDEPCTSDQECVVQNSKCLAVCRCGISYIQSHRNNSCLKAADALGEPCEENGQCTEFLEKTVCGEEGRCRCLPGHHYILPNSKCYRDIFLHEMCEVSADCATEHSECISGTCQCSNGYQQNANICVLHNSGNHGFQSNLHLLVCLFLLISTVYSSDSLFLIQERT